MSFLRRLFQPVPQFQTTSKAYREEPALNLQDAFKIFLVNHPVLGLIPLFDRSRIGSLQNSLELDVVAEYLKNPLMVPVYFEDDTHPHYYAIDLLCSGHLIILNREAGIRIGLNNSNAPYDRIGVIMDRRMNTQFEYENRPIGADVNLNNATSYNELPTEVQQQVPLEGLLLHRRKLLVRSAEA